MSVLKSGAKQATLGALNAALTVNTTKAETIAFHLLAGLVGTTTFEATVDGTNWVSIALHDTTQVALGTGIASTTAAVAVSGDCKPFRAVRARCSAYTSGSGIVKGMIAVSNGLYA